MQIVLYPFSVTKFLNVIDYKLTTLLALMRELPPLRTVRMCRCEDEFPLSGGGVRQHRCARGLLLATKPAKPTVISLRTRYPVYLYSTYKA